MRTIGELVRGVVARCAEAMIRAGVEAAAAEAEDEAYDQAVRWLAEFRDGLSAKPLVPVGYHICAGADGPQFTQQKPWDFVSTPESVAAEIGREGREK